MGAMGSYYWQGQVFAQNITESTPISTVEGPIQYDDTYMGYALVLADFTGDGKEEYAVSIPKADNLKGRVTILRNEDYKLKPLFNVSGEQLGEYFGYSVTASDLNGDGLQDLVVGAPFYSQYKAGMYEMGRVFVFYQNSQSTIKLSNSWQSIIEGKGSAGARFGTSVAGLGDINRDSYEDVVVGAPYDGDSRTGAIYIFHGSAQGVRSDPSQVIFAKDVDPGLTTFAFSVSGGNDMDKNAYPDILIGAYSSDAAIYLKSRAVIKVSVEIKVSPNIVKLDEKLCQLSDGTPVVCFTVESCLSFSGIGAPSMIELETTTTLDSKKQTGQNRALYMGGTETMDSRNITLSSRRQTCKTHMVYLKNLIRDKLNAIDVDLKYRMINLNRFSLPPILDEYIPAHIQTQAEIWKNCGIDNICIPDLRLKVKTKTREYVIGSRAPIRLDIDVRNQGEDAFEASVTLPLPTGVSYISFSNKAQTSNVRCGTISNDTQDLIVCDIGNPFPSGEKASFFIRLDPANLNGSQPYLDFNLLANSSNKENTTDMKNNYWLTSIVLQVVVDIRLTGVSQPEQILFNSSVVENPLTIEDIGPEVVHLYEVRNLGPSSIKSTTLVVFWPILLGSNLDLLYLTDVPKVIEGSGVCVVDKGVNNHNLKDAQRKHREAEAIAYKRLRRRHKRATDITSGPVFKDIKCDRESEWCTMINCDIGPMSADENTLIQIKSRLWVSSFKKGGLSSAFISSVANAQVMSVPYDIRPKEYSLDTFQIQTYAGDLSAGIEKQPIAFWIIALAIALGFIVLLLLIMAMYKCGFFKRTNLEEMKVKRSKNGSPPQKNGNTSKHSSPPIKQSPSKHSSPSIKYDSIPSNEY